MVSKHDVNLGPSHTIDFMACLIVWTNHCANPLDE